MAEIFRTSSRIAYFLNSTNPWLYYVTIMLEYSNCYFIFNNLKVSPFLLSDAPFPGFELLTHDNESWTFGTLWDIGLDAGYTKIGLGKVFGQVWVAKDLYQTRELVEFTGVKSGLTRPEAIQVQIQVDELTKQTIKATTFVLSKLSPDYKIVSDGKWLIKRK